jgi:hypothetical protein
VVVGSSEDGETDGSTPYLCSRGLSVPVCHHGSVGFGEIGRNSMVGVTVNR